MAVTINLKKQVDIPVWEWMRFAPQNTTAVSCLTVADVPADSRYLYFMAGGLGFYRYDTVSDTYHTLNYPTYSSGINAPLTSVSMRYSSYGGYRGRILSGTTTTVLIPAIQGKMFVGNTIRISNGKGAGQIKTITDVSDTIVYDSGVVTTATVNVLTDTTKRWKWNQWSGYQVSTTYGLGQTQRRKVLYNDATNLYFYDINYQAIDHFNNQGFATGGAYTTPAATAGSQTMYQIEASIVTVDTPFDIVPDYTSRFALNTGSIWFFTSLASGAFHALYKYDVAGDYWITRTATASLFPAAAGTDLTMERISNVGGVHISGTTSGTTIRTLTDYTLNLTTDRYANYQIRTVNGVAGGQRRRIVGNTSDTFYVNRKWDVVPDSGTTYEVWDDLEVIYLAGHASASVYNYSIEADLTAQGPIYDYGVASNMCLKMNGWEDIAVSTAVRTLNSIKTVNVSPIAAGANYVVGEIVTLATGTGGKVMIESVNPGGFVTSVSLFTVGSNYSVATFTQSATTGVGTGLQIAVTAVTTTGRITTALNHYFKIGNFVSFYGATEALWNNSGYTILGVDTLTTLDIEISATATAVAAFTQAASLLVSSSSNWDTNSLVGRIVCITTMGPAPTSQIRRITANTGTTITLQSAITAPVNGTSRYIIYEAYAIGRDKQYKIANKMNTGWATSGGTTTLVDSTKNWNANQWSGYKIRLLTGSGYGSELTITGNTATSLVFNATQTFVPDATTKYIIMDTFGLATAGATTTITDTTKNWTVNQWAGKKVKVTSGTGISQEILIASNTANVLTFGAVGTMGVDSTYTILGIPNRGSGIELIHVYGNSGDTRGRYMYLPRGTISNAIDRYDICEGVWEYGLTFGPNSETFTTGSMYAYDGKYKIVMQKETGRVMALDVRTNEIENIGTIPYGHSTLLIGNRMEIVETVDGLKFLYLMRSNATEMWRMLWWW